MNYNLPIPEKKTRPWYNEFVDLINRIDNVLKNEEITRESNDAEIRNRIQNYEFSTTLWIPVPVNTINRPFSKTSSTTFVKATTGMVDFYLAEKNYGILLDNIATLRIIEAIRGQRYSGSQGGELYVSIEYTQNKDITEPEEIWRLPVRSFNTDSYDPDWLQCDYILYDEELPIFLFNNIGYYNFQTYFRSKDGGEVRIANDRITLLYKIINQG